MQSAMPIPDPLFQQNLDRLRVMSPGMAEGFATLPLTNVQLVWNAKGNLIGNVWDLKRQQWVNLCHPEDPWGEAENDAEALYSPNAKIFLCLGIGLGYFPLAMAKRLKPYQRMAIFETRPTLYASALRGNDCGLLLGDRRVQTFIGDTLEESMHGWFMSFESHEKFHMHEPFRCGFTQYCDSDVYDKLQLQSLDLYRLHQVGLATWAQFGHLIGDNDLRNLPEYCINPGLDQIRGAWRDKPAVCIAAGPSLEKNLHLLTNPDIRQQVAVITVGTMYAALKHLGIEPDLVTTIDFQELNYTDQFQDVPL